MAEKKYIVTAPLVVLKVAGGSRVHLYEGAPVPAEADSQHVKQLVELKMLGEAKAVAEPDSSIKEPTVPEILEGVADDKEKAAVALEQEKAGKNRKTLVEPLEAILAKE